MACGSCGKRRKKIIPDDYDVMGGYKHLPDRQLKARLEVYKKRFCSDCVKRYPCDYTNYVACKKTNGK